MQRSITSDCTVEKLGTMLDENTRGIGLLRDEITAWLRSMDQYRAQKKGTDAQFFLSAWSDEAVIIDRVSSPSRMVWQSVGASKARVDNRYLSDPGRPPLYPSSFKIRAADTTRTTAPSMGIRRQPPAVEPRRSRGLDRSSPGIPGGYTSAEDRGPVGGRQAGRSWKRSRGAGGGRKGRGWGTSVGRPR